MTARPWARALLGAGAAATAALLTVSGTPLLSGLWALPTGALPPPAAPGTPRDADAPLSLEVLSSRPDTVMGDTVLVRVVPPAAVPADRVRLEAGGADATPALRTVRLSDGTPALEGLVSGLPEGDTVLSASHPAPGGGAEGGHAAGTARVTVTAHPLTGPVFSGPHQEPFVCDTERFDLHGGGTLGPPLDADCSAPTVVRHMYRTADGSWAPMADPDRVPGDAAETTTSTGRRVPYTVRVETGTVNRSIYETALLYTPGAPGPDPWRPPEGWNRRLVYTFGGGCAGGWYVQGARTAGVLDHGMLSQGYAVASASLNVFGHNCNDLLAAETAAAVAQRFALTHGAPDLTFGWGASGGAYQAHQIADNQPGLLDGVLVSQSFPDVGFSVVPTAADALLLREYTRAHPGALSREQQRAVSGFARWDAIGELAEEADRVDPGGVCADRVPEHVRHHPEDNPGGARCELYAHTANVYGTDPATGLPRRPLDNVGVQYGLGALLDGTIDADQFLHLNEHVGGLDADGQVMGGRTEADPRATVAAYRTGRLLNGGGGLADIPVVDHRAYEDDVPGGTIHMRFHSFSLRERLLAANGTADNHVMLVEERGRGGFSSSAPVAGRALAELDAWASGIRDLRGADPGRPAIDHVRAARPPWLADSCWVGEPVRRVVAEQRPLLAGQGDVCADAFPVYTSPRVVAGAPLALDVVACRRVPFDAGAHPAELTPGQAERAGAVFADGVCDWSVPGLGQQGLAGTWLRF
ncbi:DUF6351 family protein [Nocardiopsis sp. CT-R113]|uniref:DUF6351 family protein n=1 Tax=Nocardiopsis codii TaxID=3065942 RepID=A0ABU7KCT6_9ACTN|nr:DUF6351 family protein [Nocardiopsis sp. CT-R113]MEE2040048.1 DUF6351 family protein [Nocardiopsis sp. CT-R113]